MPGRIRTAGELVSAVARRLFGMGYWPLEVGWVKVSTGFPSLRLVSGPPEEGAYTAPEDAKVKIGLGLEISANAEWARQASTTLDLWREWGIWSLPWFNQTVTVKDDAIVFVGRRRRIEKWSFRMAAHCMGEDHVLFFGPGGPRSENHTPEELLLLADLGEPGCGRLLCEWRAGDASHSVSVAYKRRTSRRKQDRPGVRERWRNAVRLLIEDEKIVSGLGGLGLVDFWAETDGVFAASVNGKDVASIEPRSWIREIWSSGIQASWGKFPLGVRGDSVLWLEGFRIVERPMVRVESV